MFIPYYNTQDNLKQYNIDLKIANKHCLVCNKPLVKHYLYCGRCNKELLQNGLEGSRVKFGTVGRSTIPYQQYLHRSIFGCNVNLAYRGLKEERKKARITTKSMELAEIKLHKILSCNTFTYRDKVHTNNKHNKEIYLAIQDTRNLRKRLIYNTLLYYIAYHIDDNQEFKTFVHFQTSMLHNLLINIENTYIRKNRDVETRFFHQKRRYHNSNKYWYWLFTEIDKIIKPLMEELIDTLV